MNRKQRRAAQTQLQEAVKGLRRAIALRPRDAQAHNELAVALLHQGELEEAASLFARGVALMPELLEQYRNLVATLLKVNPALRAGFARVADAWPRELPDAEVLEQATAAAVLRDPLLRCMLEAGPVRDLNLERYLTRLRRLMLDLALGSSANDKVDESTLEFCCALARQCFINEYVFAVSSQETEKASRLADRLTQALNTADAVSPLVPAAVGAYFPLYQLEDSLANHDVDARNKSGHDGSEIGSVTSRAVSLLDRSWPAPVQSLLVQQVAEPKEERELRDGIVRITPIENAVSVAVQRQYEENPYPRWVTLPSDRGRMDLNHYLHQLLPAASFRELPSTGGIDILVAGCGTGQQAIATARRFTGARVLAVDLSLASLCYAKRMSGKLAADNVDYAQADLLELASLPRAFDLIEASGVLHHLADPPAGWSVLLKLLRPGGFMHVGLYSRSARGQIRAAREFFAEKGVVASPEGIRQWRGALLSTPMRSVADYADFFTTSECRDLLFHVQEHQLTIPEIDAFLRRHDLAFIGFELPPQSSASYRFRFPEDRRMANLAYWDVFEKENPATFASMYQFWVQKP